MSDHGVADGLGRLCGIHYNPTEGNPRDQATRHPMTVQALKDDPPLSPSCGKHRSQE